MNIELYSQVALARDIPAEGLQEGDVATVVETFPATAASGGESGCALEIFNALGTTIAVVIVPQSAVKPLRADELLTVRSLHTTE